MLNKSLTSVSLFKTHHSRIRLQTNQYKYALPGKVRMNKYRLSRRGFLIGGAGLAGSLATGLAGRATTPSSSRLIAVTVFNQPGMLIPPDFIGLSYETSTLSDPILFKSGNTVFQNFVRQLGSGVLRIGGNSVERMSWTGETRTSATGKSSITSVDIDRLFDFARAAGWRVMLGLNLGKSTPAIAASEAQYVARVAGNALLSLEIGNEPDLYDNNGLRSSTYGYSDFLAEFTAYSKAIRAGVPDAPFSGPTTATNTDTWAVPLPGMRLPVLAC